MMRRHHHGPHAANDTSVASAHGRHDESWRDRTLDAGKKILLVEDNADLRKLVSRVFASYDCEVLEAGTCGQAFELACRHVPDLVLMDFELPDMNGYELIRLLRQDDALRGVPIVMLTGTPRAFALVEAMHCDLAGVLRKPATAAVVIETAGRALKGRLPLKAGAAIAEDGPETALHHDAPIEPAPKSASVKELQSLLAEKLEQDYVFEADARVSDVHDAAEADTAPIIKIVNAVMGLAVDKKASDVHLEPQEKAVRVRFRIDGAMVPQFEVPSSMCSAVVARLKVMANLDIAERRVPQDGRFRMLLADGRKLEIRINTLPTRYGEKIVMRLLGQANLRRDLSSLRMHPRDRECVQAALSNPNGLILVTGPTGSGKTTTLYSMIATINTPDKNIVTVEDPVEYELPGITQVNVRAEVGLTFEKALRAFLRQDPDVMLVGEIRDSETASIALKAAATGHLVMSTLHTNDAVSAVSRLMNMGIPPYMVAAGIRMVIAQRLVRVLCPRCKAPAAIGDDDRKLLTAEEARRVSTVYAPVGCEACANTGFLGRAPVMEVLPLKTLAMRNLIMRGVSADMLQALALKEGMRTLRVGAMQLVERGETSLSEAMRILVAD